MEKLSRTACVLYKIVRVLYGLCVGCGIVTVIALALAALLPGAALQEVVSAADMTVELGTVELQLSRPLEPTGSVRFFLCAVVGSAAASLVLTACVLRLLSRILEPMAEGRPFGLQVSAALRKLALVTLAGILVSAVLGGTAAFAEIGMYDFRQLFAEGLVTGYTVEHTTEATWLLVPALLLLLSYVFRYGEELQRQSDETL